MRQPSILNVLRAVRQVGPAHPEVRAWWYAPARRLRLHGALPEGEGDAVEVVVELDLQGTDLAAIGGEIAQSLRSGPVSVRPHRGADEERQLYRLLSRGKLVRVG
jgi:hypothetical protein